MTGLRPIGLIVGYVTRPIYRVLVLLPVTLDGLIGPCETETITRLIAVTHLIQIVESPIGSVITALVALCWSVLLNLMFIFQLNNSTLLQRPGGGTCYYFTISITLISRIPVSQLQVQLYGWLLT